jgi:uncharacterized protein YbjQ (UPF0145 family)
LSRDDPEQKRDEQEREQQRQLEQDASLARVEAGGITLAAERRLAELGEGAGAFTSDLSVADFALCHRLGIRALAQVMGGSIYQVGYQSTPWPTGTSGSFMFELEAISEAWNEVRRRALDRLAQEARLVGADAVIGVQLETGGRDWVENSIEHTVIGTAVRHEATAAGVAIPEAATPGAATPGAATSGVATVGTTPRAATPGDKAPVLTELSVADYAKLLTADVEPLGIVAWSSVFFVAASYATQMLRNLAISENQELPEYTEAIYSARESTIARLTQQSTSLGASGVIGVRIAHDVRPMNVGVGAYSRGGLMVSFHAIGTAIRESDTTTPSPPEMTIDLTRTPTIDLAIQ